MKNKVRKLQRELGNDRRTTRRNIINKEVDYEIIQEEVKHEIQL